MTKRSIILGMPKHNNIFFEVIKNLEYYNFDVIFVDSTPDFINEFKYKNLKDRIVHNYRKIFFQDKTYKNKLKEQFILERTNSMLGDIQYDYSLIIRPDTYSHEFLDLIRLHTKERMVGYQWDGLNRFPDIDSRINKFDDFFVFDSNDLKDKSFKLKGITNFYFDLYRPTLSDSKYTSAYFIGCHFDARVSTVDNCAKALSDLGIMIKFIIPSNDMESILKYKNHPLITFGLDNKLSFSENLKNVNEADILVDIINPVHQGLSFRVFESLYYKKKLITNNSNVQLFDFYHPSNIFIWEENQNISELLAKFLEKPMVEIDPETMYKYSFGNWIRYVLDLKPYQKIELPHCP
ncbi:MAG: hypothetical protein J6568_05840 [Snodgrassella sp.]|nr:hypothetical protein [Snodgrassella sp.]